MKKIPLQGTEGKGLFAKVDDEDFPLLSRHKWHLLQGKYAIANIFYPNRRPVKMERLVIVPNASMVIDHINGDGLDNRKINLRFCSTRQNNWNKGLRKNNKTGFIGVSETKDGLYYASIRKGKRSVGIGKFLTRKKAAGAYDKAATKMFGEYARLNYPL